MTRRQSKAVLILSGLVAIAIPTFCFLMAAWHARTLDYGEKWGTTGFIAAFALAAVGILALAVSEAS